MNLHSYLSQLQTWPIPQISLRPKEAFNSHDFKPNLTISRQALFSHGGQLEVVWRSAIYWPRSTEGSFAYTIDNPVILNWTLQNYVL